MDAHTLLMCWEQGRFRHSLDRALLLHAAAAAAEDPDALADRTLGERNAALLRFRRQLFGDALESSIDCPACGERLEFALSADSLLTRAGTGVSHVWVDGCRVRIPTTRDLASVALEPDETSASGKLLERLIGLDASPEALRMPALANRVNRAIDEADPCLDIAIDLTCPACAHRWNASFDVAGFLWDEIEVHARRLLDEVHVLAGAYGWSETAILELSEVRRAAYLERVLA
jgi:hypothetical protein